jgi:hypothetical protein
MVWRVKRKTVDVELKAVEIPSGIAPLTSAVNPSTEEEKYHTFPSDEKSDKIYTVFGLM